MLFVLKMYFLLQQNRLQELFNQLKVSKEPTTHVPPQNVNFLEPTIPAAGILPGLGIILKSLKIFLYSQGWGAGYILTRLTPPPALAKNRPALTGSGS